MNLSTGAFDRILVRGTNWVGDALMTTPALAALQRNFPEARITVLAKPWVAPVYAHHPAVHEVMLLDRESVHRGMAGLWKAAAEVREKGFDLAVLFQNALQAAVIAWLARIPYRLGYNTDARGLLLKPAVRLRPEDKRIHETEYYLGMLARSGLEAKWTRPVFYFSDHARSRAAERLKELDLSGRFLVGIAPGAAYGPAKMWPAKRFADAASAVLAVTGGAALLFGSRSEAPVTAQVHERLNRKAYDLAGRTGLEEAAALIEQCRLFLTNDSGLMHVAAAVGTPLAAVFGSTNPDTTAPTGLHQRLVRHAVDCAPCLKPQCDQPTHLCMEQVTAEEVAAAGLELLREVQGSR